MFLRLMIPHHKAALPMARAVLERTDRPEVRRLATAIASSQKGEIKIMQEMLKSRGERPEQGSPSHTHEHH
jgi:uncharacterized protein (DUF305 family)